MKWSPAARAELIGLTRAGLTLVDACARAGLSENTVKSWLKRGRKEVGTDYADFADALDRARAEAADALMDEDEFMAHLNKAVRTGSVQAMKLWWEINGGDDGEGEGSADPQDEFDELASRRSSRAA